MDEKTRLHMATSKIDRLNERSDAHVQEVRKLQQNRDVSDEYRRRRTQEMTAALQAEARDTQAEVNELLQAADQGAAQRLATVEDAQVARRALVAGSVSRVLDAKGPGAALEAFADRPDELRQLRAEMPSWAAVNGGDPEALELAVDRALRPHATGAEADAIDVRLGLDDTRAKLSAAVRYAVSPSADTLFLRAMAAEPMPVMRNGRLERSGAA